jgi:hypothetical protein
MWKPKKIGAVIAERVVTFHRGNRRRKVVVRFGRPVHSGTKNDPWWCVIEVSGALRGLQAIAGIDSLQALTLALQYVQHTLPPHARHQGGSVEWLNERERIVFAESDSILRQWSTIANLIDGLAEAVAHLEKTSSPPRSVLANLRKLVASHGASGKKRPETSGWALWSARS